MRLATAALEAALRAHGWEHDLRSHRKNIHAFVSPSGVPVDLVFFRPQRAAETEATVEYWPMRAAVSPMFIHRSNGRVLRVPTPAYFLACKVAASRNPKRWTGPYDAKDVEDIALLLAGCSALVDSALAGPQALQSALGTWAKDVGGASTPYGRTVRELLLANAPRAVRQEVIVERLTALGSLVV